MNRKENSSILKRICLHNMEKKIKEDPAKTNTRDFRQEILNCIKENNLGVTVQDIADNIGASRNTISKYIFQLELEKEVIKKKVGVYFLYFTPERHLVQSNLVSGLYKNFLYSLKQNFPNQENIFKTIGRNIGENFKIPLDYLHGLAEGGRFTNDIPIKTFLEIFREFYPYFDVFQSFLEISIREINQRGNKATYRFTHSDFLEDTDDFIYHFYLISGIIETTFSRELKKNVFCDVVKVNISDIKANSFLEISLEIEI